MNAIPLDVRMRGRWKDAFTRIGLEDHFLQNRAGPCPICDGKDRYRWDNKDNRGTFYCNQCGPGSGVDLMMKLLNKPFAEVAKELEAIFPDLREDAPPKERSTDEKRNAMRSLWSAGKALTGDDPASLYLKRRVGLVPVCTDLRFVASATYFPDDGSRPSQHPAMIARVVDADGQSVNIHRTFLTRDGKKAAVRKPKMVMAGDIPPGAAIRLSDPAEHMAVAEGIETALSVTAMFGVPCWSTINAGRLETWTPPPGVKRVSIYGDADASYTGLAASAALAKRLVREGYEATPYLPEAGDWNDVHTAQRQAERLETAA